MSHHFVPDLSSFVVVALVVEVLAGLALAAVAVDALVRHHAVRVRRHQTVRHYYGHLALGH